MIDIFQEQAKAIADEVARLKKILSGLARDAQINAITKSVQELETQIESIKESTWILGNSPTSKANNPDSQTDKLLALLKQQLLLLAQQSAATKSSSERLLIEEQVESFKKLQLVLESRLSPDNRLEGTSVDYAGHEVVFDAEIDDEELLLLEFAQLEPKGYGVLQSKPQDIAETLWLRLNFGFNCEMLLTELSIYTEKILISDFKNYKRLTMKDSMDAIFQAIIKLQKETLLAAKNDKSGTESNNSTYLTSKDPSMQGIVFGFPTKASLLLFIEENKLKVELNLLKFLKSFAGKLRSPGELRQLDFLTYKKARGYIPRASGQRLAWAKDLGLDAILARHLPPGSLEDGLEGLKGQAFSKDLLDRGLSAFYMDVQRLVERSWNKLREPVGRRRVYEANSKFQVEQGCLDSTVTEFREGPLERTWQGLPNPDLAKGILDELAGSHPTIRKLSVTKNYKIATCLLLEFFWAVNPDFASGFKFTDKEVDLSTCQEEARNILAQLRSDRGQTVEPLIFPGEVGDSFSETLLEYKVYTDMHTDADIVDEINNSIVSEMQGQIFKTQEEKARGIKILNQSRYLEWRSNIVTVCTSDYATDSEKRAAEEGVILLGVWLPLSKHAAESRFSDISEFFRNVVKQRLTVKVEIVSTKLNTYCNYTDVTDLNEDLRNYSVKELTFKMQQEWHIEKVDSPSHDNLCKQVTELFLIHELQSDFRTALEILMQNFKDEDLKTIQSVLAEKLKASNLKPESENWILEAASTISSLQQWEQVSEWVELFVVRRKGRTRPRLHHVQDECNTVFEVLLTCSISLDTNSFYQNVDSMQSSVQVLIDEMIANFNEDGLVLSKSPGPGRSSSRWMEKAGVRMLSEVEYLKWKTSKNESLDIMLKDEQNQHQAPLGETKHERHHTASVGAPLEFGFWVPAPAQNAAEKLRAAISSLPGLSGSEVKVRTASSRRYCTYQGFHDLRRSYFLREMQVKKCRRGAKDSKAEPAALKEETARFLKQDLQLDFEFALQMLSSENPDLFLAMQQWLGSLWNLPLPKVGQSEATNDWIQKATAALNSEERWQHVARWVGAYRERIQYPQLDIMMQAKQSDIRLYCLQPVELLSIYMFTGPSYLQFNRAFRDSRPPNITPLKECTGNNNVNTVPESDVSSGLRRDALPTTLFCVSSALVKLGRRAAGVQQKCSLFRGLGGTLLPPQLWVEHRDSDGPKWKGGVESAVISATLDRAVAIKGGRGGVAEINVGRVQFGGCLGWISMVCGPISIVVKYVMALLKCVIALLQLT